MAMDESETENSDRLVEVLKEIRDELRALRSEVGGRMTTSGIRTEVVERGARWRNAALAGGGLAAVLALVLGLAMRDRPAPATFEAASSVATASTPAAARMPAPPVMAAPAPVVAAAPMAGPLPVARGTLAKPTVAVSTPATRPPARLPAGAPAIAGVPVPTKTRVKSDVAAKLPSEVASDEDEPIAFSPPARRVRVHRMSYGPVESEPAKL
jgi:hypothetical protein